MNILNNFGILINHKLIKCNTKTNKIQPTNARKCIETMDNSNVDTKNKVQWLNKKWKENKKDNKKDNREDKEEDN